MILHINNVYSVEMFLQQQCLLHQVFHVFLNYRIEQNLGSKKFWRNRDFEMLAEKTLVNPRLACILIIVCAR